MTDALRALDGYVWVCTHPRAADCPPGFPHTQYGCWWRRPTARRYQGSCPAGEISHVICDCPPATVTPADDNAATEPRAAAPGGR